MEGGKEGQKLLSKGPLYVGTYHFHKAACVRDTLSPSHALHLPSVAHLFQSNHPGHFWQTDGPDLIFSFYLFSFFSSNAGSWPASYLIIIISMGPLGGCVYRYRQIENREQRGIAEPLHQEALFMPCRLLFFSLLRIHTPKPLPFDLSWSKSPLYNALFLNLSLHFSV